MAARGRRPWLRAVVEVGTDAALALPSRVHGDPSGDSPVLESTLTSQVIRPGPSARACWLARMVGHLPSRCQRRNNPYTDSHCPYSGGTSRHGAPVRVRQQIPSISCQRRVEFDTLTPCHAGVSIYVPPTKSATAAATYAADRLLPHRQRWLQHSPVRIRQIGAGYRAMLEQTGATDDIGGAWFV
jgi:hypothetical protein